MAHVLNNEKLTSLDDLFKSTADDKEASTGVCEILLSDLYEYKKHTFKVIDDDSMTLLADSIKDSGVHQPGICRRRKEGGYEIIEGHRRHRACEIAELDTMPFYIVDWDDDTATAYMALSNLTQRKEFSIYEKAWSYRELRDSLEHKGKKGFSTISKIGEETGDSDSTIKRLIRLTYLIDELLILVDEKKLGLDPGKSISFLNRNEQQMVYEELKANDFKINITMEQAKELRDLSEKGFLSVDLIKAILEPEKKNKKRSITLKQEIIDSYFTPDYSDAEIKEIVIRLLEDWKVGQNIG